MGDVCRSVLRGVGSLFLVAALACFGISVYQAGESGFGMVVGQMITIVCGTVIGVVLLSISGLRTFQD